MSTYVCTPGVDCNGDTKTTYSPSPSITPTSTPMPVFSTCGDGTCEASESCSTCPQDCSNPNHAACQRVGMVYSIWHQPTAHAAQVAQQQNVPFLSLEDVLRSRQELPNATTPGYKLGDIYANAAVAQAANTYATGTYYYQSHPSDGYYCIYHHRDPNAVNYHAQIDAAGPYDCPNYVAQLQSHAQQLTAAGVDFVVVDMTHASDYSPASDIAQLRPFEVLVQVWAQLRASGIQTPDIAAWQALPQVGDTNETLASLVLNIYNEAANANMFLRDAATGNKVWFYPTSPTVPFDANVVGDIEANDGRQDIVAVPMWMGQQSSQVWNMFATCQNDVMLSDAPCNQQPTLGSKLGSQLSVTPSYQNGFASEPFQATGVYGGQTLRKQFAQAFALQPNYLLLLGWNEQIAQAFAGNVPSMGLENDPTAGNLGFIGLYGIEFSHDLEPTVQYGSMLYDITKSCLQLYRSGATSCSDANALCCQGGNFSADYGYYTGAQGEFGVFAANPNNDHVLLNLCVSSSNDYFLTSHADCEGQTFVRTLGYLGAAKGGGTLRPLRRCFVQSSGHSYNLTGKCPTGLSEEMIIGYAR